MDAQVNPEICESLVAFVVVLFLVTEIVKSERSSQFGFMNNFDQEDIPTVSGLSNGIQCDG
jgi:hypothetical protein